MPPKFRILIPHFAGALGFALIPSLGAQSISFQPVPQAVLEQRLKGVASDNQQREQSLKKLFEDAGCKQINELPVKGASTPNVTCTLPGTDKGSVVIGAHYDKASKGDGVIGNWSGAALLPSLYESISQIPRHFTYVFVGFTDQTKGLRGSKAYVKELSPQDRGATKAMLNLDCLGLDTARIWVAHSDKNLVANLSRVAQALKLPLNGVDRQDSAEVDSQPFADNKIPTIDFHSITNATASIPGSDKDKADQVKMDGYAESYRLLSGYLAFLDGALAAPAASK